MSVAATGSGWKTAAVNEIPPVKPDWPATWKSVRHHFGITAFGVNAVTKDTGNVLIPEHDESESGQQELYFVHAGTFEMRFGDGSSHRMEAGAVARVDPATVRSFANVGEGDVILFITGAKGGYVGRDGRLPEGAPPPPRP